MIRRRALATVTLIDTSVVVPALASWRAQHRTADGVVDGKARLVAHCAIESFFLLTRLPPPHRVEGISFATSWLLPYVRLDAPASGALIPRLVQLGMSGGVLQGHAPRAGVSGSEPELGDVSRLGQRAALLAVGGALWQRQLGTLLEIRQAQQLLGIGSRQAVHDLIQRHQLLALSAQDRRTLTPSFQFTEIGRPHAAIRPILRIFAEAEATGWTVASWFTSPRSELDGQTPLEWIRASGELETVLDAAPSAAAPLRW